MKYILTKVEVITQVSDECSLAEVSDRIQLELELHGKTVIECKSYRTNPDYVAPLTKQPTTNNEPSPKIQTDAGV